MRTTARSKTGNKARQAVPPFDLQKRPTGGNACRALFAQACLVVLLSGLCLAAEEVSLPALGQLASALSQGDSVSALEVFDPKMADYAKLETAIGALTAQAEILCAIELVEEKEAGDTLTVDTDWYLQLKSRSEGGTTERRRERVTLRFKKLHNKWRITGFMPMSILAPVTVR
jgi:ketosteroid isomerase-like protein